MNVNAYSRKISEGNQGLAFGNWRKVDPCFTVAMNRDELCSHCFVESGFCRNQIEYLAEATSEPNGEGRT